MSGQRGSRKSSYVTKYGMFICERCANGEHLGAIHVPGICDCPCRVSVQARTEARDAD